MSVDTMETASNQTVVILKRIWPWIRRAAVLVAVVLLVRLVVNNAAEFQSSLQHLDYPFLVLSVILSGLGFFVSSLAWRSLLGAQGVPMNARQAWWSSTYSFIFRYLPGAVPGVAARVGVMRQMGIRVAHGSWNVMIEMGLSACVALVFFLIGGWGGSAPAWLRWLTVAGLVLGVFGMLLLSTSVFRAWRERFRLPTLIGARIPLMLIWFTVVWLTFGLAHWCLVKAVGLENNIGFFPVTGAYAFSWVVGLVAVFTPSGLGVREAAMISLLQPSLGPAAIVFALLSRFIFTAGELLNIVVAWLFRPRKDVT